MKVVCPVCSGSLRQACDPKRSAESMRYYYSYDASTHTVNCRNCGGQTMSSRPTGMVNARPDGSPCTHVYTEACVGRCLRRYTCKHCNDSYVIDSGD